MVHLMIDPDCGCIKGVQQCEYHRKEQEVQARVVEKDKRLKRLEAALRAFPQPGLPGKPNWMADVVSWWNTTGREALR